MTKIGSSSIVPRVTNGFIVVLGGAGAARSVGVDLRVRTPDNAGIVSRRVGASSIGLAFNIPMLEPSQVVDQGDRCRLPDKTMAIGWVDSDPVSTMTPDADPLDVTR